MTQNPTRNLTGFVLLMVVLVLIVLSTMAFPGAKPPEELGLESGATHAALLMAGLPQIEMPARLEVATVSLLQVEVRDPAGLHVPGARVVYYPETVIGFPEEIIGEADERGAFTSPLLTEARYRIRVEAPGFRTSATRQVHLPAPAGQPLTFILDRAAIASGPSKP